MMTKKAPEDEHFKAIREKDRKMTWGKGQWHKAHWEKKMEKERNRTTITEEAYHPPSASDNTCTHAQTHRHGTHVYTLTQHIHLCIQTKSRHRKA